MREAYAIYQNCLMALCLAAPFAALAAYGLCRLARSARMAGARRVLAAILFAAPAIYLGATKGGHVTVNDAYIEDAGSYLTNDIAHIAIAKRTALLPDNTEILVYAREAASTNAADWTRLSPHLAYSAHPYDYPLANATNYNVLVAANYTPPPTVHTNGVWVCYAGLLWDSGFGDVAFGFPASKIALKEGVKPWTNPYVTDGLVAMWDGEWNAGGGVHDAEATVWKDLIGDYDFTLNNAATVNADHIYCNGSKAAGDTGRKIDLSVVQMEIVFRYIYSPVNTAIFMTGGYISYYYREVFCITAGNSYFGFANRCPALKDNNVNDYSINLDTLGYWRYGEYSTYYPTYNTLDQGDARGYIGRIGGTGNCGCQCEIYSVRLYNRALTAEEVAANYAVDRARFPIP